VFAQRNPGSNRVTTLPGQPRFSFEACRFSAPIPAVGIYPGSLGVPGLSQRSGSVKVFAAKTLLKIRR
jgi:hypothetical protein